MPTEAVHRTDQRGIRLGTASSHERYPIDQTMVGGAFGAVHDR